MFARHFIFIVGSLMAFILAHIAANTLFVVDRADYTQFGSGSDIFRYAMRMGILLWTLGLVVESCFFLLTPAIAESDPTITYSTFDAVTTVALASASSLSMLSAFAICTMVSHSRIKWIMKGISVALIFLMFLEVLIVVTLERDLQLPPDTVPTAAICIIVSLVSAALFLVCAARAKRLIISEWNTVENAR